MYIKTEDQRRRFPRRVDILMIDPQGRFRCGFRARQATFLHGGLLRRRDSILLAGFQQDCLTSMLQIRQICHNVFELCRCVYGRAFLFSWILLALVGSVLRGEEDSTLSVDVKVVNVLATVRNKQGQIVRDLNQGDFKLEEDSRPQTIRYFTRETNLPLTLGLLVDTSLSQRRLLGQERTASYQFLQQVLREEKDMAFLLHFDREVELLQ